MAKNQQPTPPPAAPPRRTMAIAVVVAAVVIALAIAAIVATRSGSDTEDVASGSTDSSVEKGPVTITGAALPPMPDAAATDPASGMKAPTLAGLGFDGSPISITPGERPTVVMFVAHWCPHCQREVPQVVKWLAAGVADGIDLRVVSTGTDPTLPNYPPSSWLAGEGLEVPTMVDSETTVAANAYGLTSFPYFVALDAKGNVTERMAGELTDDQFTALVAAAKA